LLFTPPFSSHAPLSCLLSAGCFCLCLCPFHSPFLYLCFSITLAVCLLVCLPLLPFHLFLGQAVITGSALAVRFVALFNLDKLKTIPHTKVALVVAPHDPSPTLTFSHSHILNFLKCRKIFTLAACQHFAQVVIARELCSLSFSPCCSCLLQHGATT